jgi:hypothetical protein
MAALFPSSGLRTRAPRGSRRGAADPGRSTCGRDRCGASVSLDVPLSREDLRETTDLLRDMAEQVVEGDDPDQSARVVHDRHATYTRGLHSLQQLRGVFPVARRHGFGRHHVANGGRFQALVCTCKHGHDDVAVSQQANGEQLAVELVHDDNAPDMFSSHTSGDLMQRLPRSSDGDAAIAQLSSGRHRQLRMQDLCRHACGIPPRG